MSEYASLDDLVEVDEATEDVDLGNGRKVKVRGLPATSCCSTRRAPTTAA